jgi:hypothetical protein
VKTDGNIAFDALLDRGYATVFRIALTVRSNAMKQERLLPE